MWEEGRYGGRESFGQVHASFALASCIPARAACWALTLRATTPRRARLRLPVPWAIWLLRGGMEGREECSQ